MGGCQANQTNSNMNLDFFINKYGLQTVLQIAVDQKKKQVCIQKIPQINKDYTAKIHQDKIQTIGQINKLQNQLNWRITQRVKMIEVQKPGLVSKAQKKHDMSAEQIMGMKKNKDKLSTLRNQTLKDYQTQQKNVKQKIDGTVQKFVQKIEHDKKTKIEQYDTLTQNDKLCLKKQLERRYKKQIKINLEKAKQQLKDSKQCHLHNNQEMSKLKPTQQMEQIKEEALRLRLAGQHEILGRQHLIQEKDINDKIQMQGCMC